MVNWLSKLSEELWNEITLIAFAIYVFAVAVNRKSYCNRCEMWGDEWTPFLSQRAMQTEVSM